MPEISVIVAVYKAEPYIHHCVDSILNQTFTDFELILVDDGSPDHCGKICDEYARNDCRIKVIHQENAGAAAARNSGIDWIFENSDSNWITFVDSDDGIHKEYLYRLYSIAKKYSTDISVCTYVNTSNCVLANEKKYETILLNFEEFWSKKETGICRCAPWGKLYCKYLWNHIRFPVGKYAEDLYTIPKVLEMAKGISFIKNTMYYYNDENVSLTRSLWNNHWLDEIEGYKELIRFMDEKHYIKGKIRTVEMYEGVLKYQLDQIAMSNADVRYVRILRNDLRNALRRYKKIVFVNFSERIWLLEAAYPRLMQKYWLWQALLQKLNLKK